MLNELRADNCLQAPVQTIQLCNFIKGIDMKVTKVCECPLDKRKLIDYYIEHTSRVNVYECTICKKIH